MSLNTVSRLQRNAEFCFARRCATVRRFTLLGVVPLWGGLLCSALYHCGDAVSSVTQMCSLATDRQQTHSVPCYRQQTYSVPCYRQTADPQCPVSGWVHWARVAEGVQIRRLVITRHPMLVKSSLCRGQHEGVWMGRLSSYSEPHPPSTPPQQKQCGWNYRQTQRQPEDGETAATQSNSSCPEWTRHVNACAEDRPS